MFILCEYLSLSIGRKRTDKMQREGQTDARGEKIGAGLSEDNTVHPQETRQKQDHRNEANPVAQTCQRRRRTAFADALVEHIGALHKHGDGHCHALCLQGGCADGDDLRIVAELCDNEVGGEEHTETI